MRALLPFACLAALATCAGPSQAGLSRAEVARQVAALAALGRALFFDPALSASRAQACASCHDPAHQFGPPGPSAVVLGGKHLRQPGLRAVPSLKYLQATPQFSEHYYDSDEEGDASVDNGPTGGLTWDGRVDRGREQARLPLMSPFEMANDGADEIVATVRKAPYAVALRKLYGAAVFSDRDKAFEMVLEALEAFEQSYRDFYPYSSKYDAYLGGATTLTPTEMHGLALFNDPAKGNCAHCHTSARGRDGTPPQFTDYGFAALGVPRNPAIAANRDPLYFDLGLCGPQRTDLADHPEYCGMFKTPSLRNVATRQVFFHNGAFHQLRDAVAFYAQRDSNPEKFYPRDIAGRVQKFDDLPERYWTNINVEPPFDRHQDDPAALSEPEIEDIAAFLQTLTDGYRSVK